MPSNAVSATIAKARSMASNPATAKVPVTLASIATAAGYPGSKASPVRALARANGNGARANGATRYTANTPAQWVALLTGSHAALSPQATTQAKAKARSKATRNAWLGKAARATGKAAKATAPQATTQASN